MDPKVKGFLERTIVNCKRAIIDNDPELAWAVIKNLNSVIDGYERAALDAWVAAEEQTNSKYWKRKVIK